MPAPTRAAAGAARGRGRGRERGRGRGRLGCTDISASQKRRSPRLVEAETTGKATPPAKVTADTGTPISI